jgi:hypothetical protein
MTDTPYYSPSKGTLTGIDSAILTSTGVNIAETGWSVQQLKTLLQNKAGSFFPSADWVALLESEIENHLEDFNNPHHVTLAQIAGDLVTDVLGTIVPGTVPDLPPFFSFDAVLALPLGDIYPATYTPTNVYRMAAGGACTNPASEIENVATSYVTGTAGVPLYSAFISTVAATWATQQSAPINTTIAASTDVSYNYPFPFYTVSEIEATGQFGVSIAATQAQGTGYIFSCLIRPSAVGGTLTLSMPSDTTNVVKVDLGTGDVTASTALVSAQSWVYADGTIRVSMQYQSSLQTTDNSIQVIHTMPSQTDSTRHGVAGQVLFSLAVPTNAIAAFGHPLPVNPQVAASVSPMVFDLSKVSAPTTLASCLLTLTVELYPHLSTVALTDTTLLTFGAVSLTRDKTTVYLKLNGSTLFSTPILPGAMTFTISYSPTTIIFKSSLVARQSVTGTYPALQTTTVSVGPCGGSLERLAFYAMADSAACVEYLTDG